MKDSTTTSLTLDQLVEGANVRTNMNDMTALVDSIKASGILQPLLVRPKKSKYEIVCGHRRAAAAHALNLPEVPVRVREMTDAQALAAQIIENDQREEAHPLDQADGYQRLMLLEKLDAAGVAMRTGRPESHVYDRVRLLGLNKQAKQLFRNGSIAVGHAVLLARLKPADQDRAMETSGALFTHEDVLELAENETRRQKVRTVRELQGWIDRHVRFDVAASDLPQLFPATAAALKSAETESRKVVAITHEHATHPDAKDFDERTYGHTSWRRADGAEKSRPCTHSVLGVIVSGPERGRAFDVCIEKKKCAVHWPAEARAAERVSKGLASERKPSAEDKRHAAAQAKEQALRAQRLALDEQWKRATLPILELVAGKLKSAKVTGGSPIADELVAGMATYSVPPKGKTLMRRGKTAEELIRYLMYLKLAEQVSGYYAFERTPKLLKALGIDVKPVLAKFPLTLVKPAPV